MRALTCLALTLQFLRPAHAAPPTVDQILDTLGPLSGSEADPLPVIHAVNRLQPMGQAKGTAALRAWLKGRKDPPGAIFLVMRALFTGKARPPALGAPSPAPTTAELKHLPRYPLLVLDGVPLSVVDGYLLGGLPEPPLMYLDELERTGTWTRTPLTPKSVGSVLFTLPHFGLYGPKHPVMTLIHRQLQRLEGPPPTSGATFHNPQTRGQPFLTVKGGRLPQPVTVPLWLTITDADPDQKCAIHHEAVLMIRPDGTLYVEQYNNLCETRGAGCKLYDPWTDRWSPVKACVDPGFGVHRRATALGGDWVLAAGDSEGVAAARLVRWTPQGGQKSIVDLEPTEAPRWILGGIWLRSERPLAKGATGSHWYFWDEGWKLADANSAWWVGSL